MDYNKRNVELLRNLYEFSEENIQWDHAKVVDEFVASNPCKFSTKEVGIVLIENLRRRFLYGGHGLDGECMLFGEELWGENGKIQTRKRQREFDGHVFEMRKKHNRSDSFGSSDSWIWKTYGGDNGGGGGILNQEGNNGGDNEVNMGGGGNDVQDLGDQNGDGGAQNVAVPGG
ncbi:hypothetical protein Tco_1255761 [Tanacetum coccineum]